MISRILLNRCLIFCSSLLEIELIWILSQIPCGYIIQTLCDFHSLSVWDILLSTCVCYLVSVLWFWTSLGSQSCGPYKNASRMRIQWNQQTSLRFVLYMHCVASPFIHLFIKIWSFFPANISSHKLTLPNYQSHCHSIGSKSCFGSFIGPNLRPSSIITQFVN